MPRARAPRAAAALAALWLLFALARAPPAAAKDKAPYAALWRAIAAAGAQGAAAPADATTPPSDELIYAFCDFVYQSDTGSPDGTMAWFVMSNVSTGFTSCQDPSNETDAGMSCFDVCQSTGCLRYLMNSCDDHCCGDCPKLRALVPGAFPANWCGYPSTIYPKTGCGYVCDKDGSRVQGDPHFVGFDGTRFFFEGREGGVFALLSEPHFQVNALFGGVGPREGAQTTIWMIGFGIRYGDAFSFEVRIRPEAAAHMRLVKHKKDKKRGIKGLLRVELDDAFDSHLFTATLNGRNADHLLHSGTSAGQLPDSVSLYFPPATAVNPNDAHDGPIAIFKSPLIDLTISRETEGAAHLDLGVRLAGRIPEMHGVLGQTLGWAKHGSEGKVVDGNLAAETSEFEVRGGLLGTEFAHTMFGRRAVSAPAAEARATRRLLAAGEAGPLAFEPALDSAGMEGGAAHLLRRVPCLRASEPA